MLLSVGLPLPESISRVVMPGQVFAASKEPLTMQNSNNTGFGIGMPSYDTPVLQSNGALEAA